MNRLAFITNIPTPYRKAQIKLITERLQREHRSLNVYFTESSGQDRKWEVANEFNYHFLPVIFRTARYGNLNWGLISIVRTSDCVIIGGYEQPSYILTALLCRLLRKPYVIAFDGIAPSKIHAPQRSLLTRIKTWMLRGAKAAFANGIVSEAYIRRSLGLSHLAIFNQYLSTDSHCIQDRLHHRSLLRDRFLENHGLRADTRLVLYSGRLIERKHVSDLIHALQSHSNSTLIIAGHGPLESELQALCTQLNQQAIFLGHLDEEDLASVYVVVDCLVLPSTDEPWGLVVNEALFAHTPVVVSNDCGCAEDLVDQGKNGYVYPARDLACLSSAINSALALNRNSVAEAAAYTTKTWNLDTSAASFMQMIAYIG